MTQKATDQAITFSFFLAALFFFTPAFAQKEGNIWYFGHQAGITFNTNPPSALFDSQASGLHGHATISDQNGNLLFYFSAGNNSGGAVSKQVFGRNHLPMPNGSGFYGLNAPTVIIPWPGTQKYYLFTYAPHQGYYEACYSVIDMNLNNGFGDVTAVKNVIFNPGAQPYWKRPIAIKHRNNRDYWLIYMEFSTVYNTTTFTAYSITPAGLNLTPVVSPISQSIVNGKLKASPDGTTIVANSLIGFDLFNFDAATGGVSHRFTVGLPNASSIHPLEFSPDGTKLYLANYVLPGSPMGKSFYLAQFDITAPTGVAVMTSGLPIYWQDSTNQYPGFILDMQLAPDGKIYMTYGYINSYRKYLHVIHRPNLSGRAARFQPGVIDLDPNNTGNHHAGQTLPFFIQGFFYRPKIDLQQTCFGDTASFSLTNAANADSVKWNFGDPASGTLNHSTANTPKHFYATAGNYTVQAIVYYPFSADTISQTIFIPTVITKPKLGNDTTLCLGDTLKLNAFQAGATYEWQDSITTGPDFNVTRSGTYWVQVSNGCGTRADSINVKFDEPLVINFGPDTTLCPGEKLTLKVNTSGSNIVWQDGSIQNTYTITKPGIYHVLAQNSCGRFSDTIQVFYRQPVAANWLPKDTLVCSPNTYEINGRNEAALSYRWQDGSTDSVFTAQTSGWYWLEITTTCGIVRDSVQVKIEPCPKAPFIPNIVTPNGDNLNDKFDPQHLETGEYALSIYNRWGTLIFQNENYTNQWPDKKLSDGTYYYLLRNKETGKIYKGWVEVAN